MGTDIHVSLEAKDHSGNWHCIWDGRLPHTEWFEKNCVDPLYPKEDRYNVHGTNDIRSRDYDVFGMLSGVRGKNYLYEDGIGTEKGIMKNKWPDTLSYCTSDLKNDYDYYSRGYINIKKLRKIRKKLKNIIEKRESEGGLFSGTAPAHTLLRWINYIETFLDKLIGETPLIGNVIGQVPDEKNDSENFPIHSIGSSHESMANVSGKNWQNLTRKPKDIRILVCYDN
jgi:hypothetical protein